jgi:hypothetical protein
MKREVVAINRVLDTIKDLAKKPVALKEYKERVYINDCDKVTKMVYRIPTSRNIMERDIFLIRLKSQWYFGVSEDENEHGRYVIAKKTDSGSINQFLTEIENIETDFFVEYYFEKIKDDVKNIKTLKYGY